jgi:hypothetical protein
MKLKDFIICDDIRTEANNKFSLMGVYNDALNFSVPKKNTDKWPKVVHLGFFIRLDIESIEELKSIGKFVLEATINKKINFQAEQIFDEIIHENHPLHQMVISVVFDQVNIYSTGEMELSLSVYNKNNGLIEKFVYPGNIKVSVAVYSQN